MALQILSSLAHTDKFFINFPPNKQTDNLSGIARDKWLSVMNNIFSLKELARSFRLRWLCVAAEKASESFMYVEGNLTPITSCSQSIEEEEGKFASSLSSCRKPINFPPNKYYLAEILFASK